MSQSGEEKEGEKSKNSEESKNQEQIRSEVNVALSQATIREDVEKRDEMTEHVADQHKCDECADTHTGRGAQEERPLKKGDQRLRVDELPPKLSEAVRTPHSALRIPLKRRRESSFEPLNPPLKDLDLNILQHDPANRHSPYSDSATAPLDHYIRLVSASMSLPTPPNPCFSSKEHAPLLHRNRENKVITYQGSFNPPHLGHVELAYHAFLRSSSTTIALLLPLCDLLEAKDGALVNGNTFATTKAQRIALLQDDLLQRWTWFYKGHRTKAAEYQATMTDEAKKDGFQLSFTALSGSDHWEACTEADSISWVHQGTGDLVTSDITRPSSLFVGLDCPPKRLHSCGSWRLVSTPSSRKGSFGCGCGNVNRECLTSRRIREYCGGHAALEGGLHVRSRQDDVLHKILVRCHTREGLVWVCHRERGGTITFFSSGRDIEGDGKRDEVSSSAVRKILGGGGSQDEMIGKLAKVVLNPGLLLQFCGLGN
jgi:hypothetical protein